MALAYPDPPLADDTVSLRPWELSDVSLVEQAGADPYVAQIERVPVPFVEASARDWIEERQSQVALGRGWSFVTVEAQTNEARGGVSLTFRHPPGAAEVGYWVVEGARNRGLAARATRLISHWGLPRAGFARIQATVEPWNLPSQRVFEKVGFLREGLLRSYASYGGARQDVFLYSLLPTDLG